MVHRTPHYLSCMFLHFFFFAITMYHGGGLLESTMRHMDKSSVKYEIHFFWYKKKMVGRPLSTCLCYINAVVKFVEIQRQSSSTNKFDTEIHWSTRDSVMHFSVDPIKWFLARFFFFFCNIILLAIRCCVCDHTNIIFVFRLVNELLYSQFKAQQTNTFYYINAFWIFGNNKSLIFVWILKFHI